MPPYRPVDSDRLWAGQTMSLLGDEMGVFALATVALVFLHANPASFGLLIAASFLPQPVLALLAGAWVDRMRHRTVLLAADGVRALAMASVPLAALAGALTIAQLIVVGLVFAAASTLHHAASPAYLRDVVPPDGISRARARR
ncbi:MAG TPA: MFS transporter, partial [Rugosimonospora sp.]|nr:MFS transporter [Rugosimonospora sp.]